MWLFMYKKLVNCDGRLINSVSLSSFFKFDNLVSWCTVMEDYISVL